MDVITISIFGVSGIVGLIIFIITAVSISRNPNHRGIGKFLWILVALFFSVLGSVLWLLFGRGRV